MAVARKAGVAKRQMAARTAVVGANRGYLRTGGYYGRFRGRRASSGGELKFVDTALASTIATIAGVVNPNLVVVPQNDTESGRIGRRITVKSIWFKGNLEIATSASVTSADDMVRLIVVQDQQANGAAFTVAQVLEGSTYNSFKNLENERRFRILSDQTFAVNAMSSFAAATCERNIKWHKYIKCNIPIDYDATAATGAIATQRSNSIAVLMISQQQVTNVTYNCRIRYSDV